MLWKVFDVRSKVTFSKSGIKFPHSSEQLAPVVTPFSSLVVALLVKIKMVSANFQVLILICMFAVVANAQDPDLYGEIVYLRHRVGCDGLSRNHDLF